MVDQEINFYLLINRVVELEKQVAELTTTIAKIEEKVRIDGKELADAIRKNLYRSAF